MSKSKSKRRAPKPAVVVRSKSAIAKALAAVVVAVVGFRRSCAESYWSLGDAMLTLHLSHGAKGFKAYCNSHKLELQYGYSWLMRAKQYRTRNPESPDKDSAKGIITAALQSAGIPTGKAKAKTATKGTKDPVRKTVKLTIDASKTLEGLGIAEVRSIRPNLPKAIDQPTFRAGVMAGVVWLSHTSRRSEVIDLPTDQQVGKMLKELTSK